MIKYAQQTVIIIIISVCEGCSDVGIGACTGPDECCYYFDIDGSCIEECPDDYSPDVDTFQCGMYLLILNIT